MLVKILFRIGPQASETLSAPFSDGSQSFARLVVVKNTSYVDLLHQSGIRPQVLKQPIPWQGVTQVLWQFSRCCPAPQYYSGANLVPLCAQQKMESNNTRPKELSKLHFQELSNLYFSNRLQATLQKHKEKHKAWCRRIVMPPSQKLRVGMWLC